MTRSVALGWRHCLAGRGTCSKRHGRRASPTLQRFVEREGHARVPHGLREDGLGRWVSHQRALARRGELSAERTSLLESVRGWTWQPRETAWEDGYARLREFVTREGHPRVPAGYQDDDGFKLGLWVQNQRARGQRGELSAERTSLLESVRGWTWQPGETAWEDGYARLREFVTREGHPRVPAGYQDDDGFKLGLWVQNQRARGRRGAVSYQRARRLEAVPGWTWHPQEAAWEDGYARLREFVAHEGHARVPQRTIQDGFHLGPWVNTQRMNYLQGKLDRERRAQLEALPGWTWDARQPARAR